MVSNTDTAYIGPSEIMKDWGVSRATAYNIIRKMNADLKEKYPSALIIAGKVNRIWYEEACLMRPQNKGGY